MRAKMIKVAIIDSGIDDEDENLMNQVIGGISFGISDNGNIYRSNVFQDENGHGTLCAKIILKYAPLSSLYIVKILDKDLRSNSQVLLSALEYLKELDIDIINLSLATANESNKSKMELVCRQLSESGKIIIASYSNDGKKKYPALFSTVLGVKAVLINNNQEFLFDKESNNVLTDITPLFINTSKMGFQMICGCSKATAVFTSIVSNIWIENKDSDNNKIVNLISRYAVKGKWISDIVNLEDCELGKKNKDGRLTYHQQVMLHDAIIDHCPRDITSIIYDFDCRALHRMGYDAAALYTLICCIEEKFNIFLNKNFISMTKFYSFNNLTYTIGDRIYGKNK